MSIGTHSALNCWATGDPLPDIKWVTMNKVLSNMTAIGESSDHYIVKTITNNTFVYSVLELGIYGDHHPSNYSCIASNPANSVTKIIQVVVGTDRAEESGPAGLGLPVLITIALLSLAVIILLVLVIYYFCCKKKRSSPTPHNKMNGSARDHSNVMVVPPPNPVNPVGKPPRQYEKLPQKDIEMTHVGNTSMEGGHKNYDELNYPHGNHSNYTADHRSRLPPLDEGVISHPSSPFLVPHISPSPTLTMQSNITQTTTSHYPDLLDNARVPRTISPTQISYQNLAYPPLGQEWRYSYAHPTDYSSVASSEYGRSPVAAYSSTPQHHQRPGYVTLPRRPRAPSLSGVPTNTSLHIVANPMLSPQAAQKSGIYDTLGPRTTADGTSTTDLTRPGSRTGMYEPFPPTTGQAAVPTSPHALAAHYTSMRAAKQRQMKYAGQARPGTSQTLPRSTPNLLDDSKMSIPQYHNRHLATQMSEDPYTTQLQLRQNAECQPLIQDESTLGIPFNPSSANVDETTNLIEAEYDSSINHSDNNNSSRNNYNDIKSGSSKTQRQLDAVSRNLRSISPSVSPSDKSSNRTLNSSMSPGSPSPTPTPTQILSSASPHKEQQHREASPPVNGSENGYSLISTPSFNTSGLPPVPPLSHSPAPLVQPPSSTTATLSGKKKVPPKPPPKPSSKRLSVTSMTSDPGNGSVSRQTSLVSSGGPFLDEGPDGSEV